MLIEHVVGHVQIAEFARDLGVFRHGIAGDADFAFVVAGGIHHLLHPRHQRGESRHHDAALCPSKDAVQGITDDRFGLCPAGLVRVGAVGQQQRHAALREAGQRA